MQFSRFHLRTVFFGAVVFAGAGLAGCGNTCVVGFSINGNGGVIVRAGDPPPTCSLSQAKGAVTVLAVKSPVCESCLVPARVNHVFVTLRGIQLRQSTNDDPNSHDWIELAPYLANEPRQVDLLGDSLPAILVKDAMVPAGSYRELRLQFLTGSLTSPEALPAENPCGVTRWNCTVIADGHIGQLHFPGDSPELLILPRDSESDSLLVLPDATMELHLNLELHHGLQFSAAEGWKTQSVIVGHAKVERESSFEQRNSTPVQAF
jgi:hypothetical protein